MTVASTTSKVSYSGNGSTTAFAVPFAFWQAADLQVILRTATGLELPRILSTDYTVSGAGNVSGGTVSMYAAPSAGDVLVISRVVTLTQDVDYLSNDAFPSETHERALDRLTMGLQQVSETLGRTIKLSPTNTITTSEFNADAAARANKMIGFDGNGDLMVTEGAQAAAAANSATAAARSATQATLAAAAALQSATAAATWNPANYATKASPSFTGTASFGGPINISYAWAALELNKPASGSATQIVGYTNNVRRWSLELGGAGAETGSNAGSDFGLARYSDAGIFIDAPLLVSRKTGNVLLGGTYTDRGAKQTIKQTDGLWSLFLEGQTTGARFYSVSAGYVIEATDNSGAAVYKCLILGGSEVQFFPNNGLVGSVNSSGLTLQPSKSITFGDGSIQTTAAQKLIGSWTFSSGGIFTSNVNGGITLTRGNTAGFYTATFPSMGGTAYAAVFSAVRDINFYLSAPVIVSKSATSVSFSFRDYAGRNFDPTVSDTLDLVVMK